MSVIVVRLLLLLMVSIAPITAGIVLIIKAVSLRKKMDIVDLSSDNNTSMYCGKCGEKLNVGAAFCKKCGTKVEPVNNVGYQTNSKVVSNGKGMLITGIILCSVGALMFIIFLLSAALNDVRSNNNTYSDNSYNSEDYSSSSSSSSSYSSGKSSKSSFSIEGKWKNVGSTGFGQAQPGAIVKFDGTNCNLYSPADTYAFYKSGDSYVLDITSVMGGDSMSSKVNVIDSNNIEIKRGSTLLTFKRMT